MNFGTFKTLITRNLGGRSDITPLIGEWLNSCYLDLVTRGKFPELKRFAPIPVPELDATATFPTADGTPDYAQPSNALFPISVRDATNNHSLAQRDIRWYDRNKSTVGGKPLRYATFGGRLWFDPTPDGVYTIQERFRKKVTIPALQADSDVPLIGQEWHEALELGGTYRGALSLGYPDAERWLGRLQSFMIAHSEQYTEEEEDVDVGFSVVM